MQSQNEKLKEEKSNLTIEIDEIRKIMLEQVKVILELVEKLKQSVSEEVSFLQQSFSDRT